MLQSSEVDSESDESTTTSGRGDSAFGLGPRKRICRTDPLVHHGRHFGRTIQAFCKVQTLIKNGLSRSIQLKFGRLCIDDLTPSERYEHNVYEQMLALSPGLEERLCNGSEQDIFYVAELIQKGSAGARADNTKGLKGVVLDWITPYGQSLQPPLMRNVKTDSRLLCPIDLDWTNQESSLLLSVRFALSSSPTFSRTDLVTDSERFYSTVVEAFTAPEYADRVSELLAWWDAKIFPTYSERSKTLKKGSVLALMRSQRLQEAGARAPSASGS
ncbi:hypothetical protein BKA70DRAFT_1374803 [Coprinopsis sp. MPI-PUGE-AT-0042]|nr:hypothetical protein BKA70DRAFT_1374803 [Coprinopsis sp. MPI-PUGE-AT-0042]